MNKVQLTGRLTKNVEVKVSQNDKKYAFIDVAVRKTYKNAKGEYDTNFIRVQLWEQRAEFLSQYATKGSMVGITGSIETRNYTNADGQKIYEIYVLADSVEVLSQAQKQPKTDIRPSDVNDFDDDLPF